MRAKFSAHSTERHRRQIKREIIEEMAAITG
jgi:hypothetical protein